MSSFDELREKMHARQVGSMGALDNFTENVRRKAWAQAIAMLDAFEANACEGCRHWGGEPGDAATYPCLVSGSFRAPGGLFTEGGFCCCHWTES